MTSALIIRPSSLGDIVHAMPVVHDLLLHDPGIAIDWVAEEPFAGLIALTWTAICRSQATGLAKCQLECGDALLRAALCCVPSS